MSKEGRGTVVLCTHGILDDLVAPLMLDYLLKLTREASLGQVLLISEEKKIPELSVELAARLTASGITWLPLIYDVKGPQWSQKVRVAWTVFWKVRRFMRPFAQRFVIGYLSMAGSYAMILGKLGFGKSITVCFEPHSEYMLEMRVWPRRSLKYRLMSRLERIQMRWTDILVVPTTAVRSLALRHGRRKPLLLQGITIDVGAASFDPEARERLRQRYAIGDRTVVAYVGKFGGIYHTLEEYIAFMVALSDRDPELVFLVITHQEWLAALIVHPHADAIRERIIAVPPVPPSELPGWLSAADLGVVAIPPTPSQSFRTPVKSAYYWAAGLPIIIPAGVSDDHSIATQEDVGIVVADLTRMDVPAIIGSIARYRTMDQEQLRARCMRVARAHRDTERMITLLKEVFR